MFSGSWYTNHCQYYQKQGGKNGIYELLRKILYLNVKKNIIFEYDCMHHPV
jgi:hypothetical protein